MSASLVQLSDTQVNSILSCLWKMPQKCFKVVYQLNWPNLKKTLYFQFIQDVINNRTVSITCLALGTGEYNLSLELEISKWSEKLVCNQISSLRITWSRNGTMGKKRVDIMFPTALAPRSIISTATRMLVLMNMRTIRRMSRITPEWRRQAVSLTHFTFFTFFRQQPTVSILS